MCLYSQSRECHRALRPDRPAPTHSLGPPGTLRRHHQIEHVFWRVLLLLTVPQRVQDPGLSTSSVSWLQVLLLPTNGLLGLCHPPCPRRRHRTVPPLPSPFLWPSVPRTAHHPFSQRREGSPADLRQRVCPTTVLRALRTHLQELPGLSQSPLRLSTVLQLRAHGGRVGPQMFHPAHPLTSRPQTKTRHHQFRPAGT